MPDPVPVEVAISSPVYQEHQRSERGLKRGLVALLLEAIGVQLGAALGALLAHGPAALWPAFQGSAVGAVFGGTMAAVLLGMAAIGMWRPFYGYYVPREPEPPPERRRRARGSRRPVRAPASTGAAVAVPVMMMAAAVGIAVGGSLGGTFAVQGLGLAPAGESLVGGMLGTLPALGWWLWARALSE